MKMNIQLFGADFPPFYRAEDAVAIIEKIAKLDEQINALFIERESYVATLKEKIKEIDAVEA